MGVTDQFVTINAELSRDLGYHLNPESADDFRSLLRRAGIRRVRHCIKLVALEGHRGGAAHKRLVDQIWVHMPEKRGKYRNPYVGAERLAQRREFEYAMQQDGD